MPSRKRLQAKARKEKETSKCPPLFNWREHYVFGKGRCNHGCPKDILSSNDEVRGYLDELESLVRNKLHMNCGPGPGLHALRSLEEANTNLRFNFKPRREMAKIITMMATDHLIYGDMKTYDNRMKDHASVVLILESDIRGLEVVGRLRDLRDDATRELVKFFKSRIPCNCLDRLYGQCKSQTQQKMGTCQHCRTKKQRSLLLLCSACKCDQYCSSACQAAAWAKHKVVCKSLIKEEAEVRGFIQFQMPSE